MQALAITSDEGDRDDAEGRWLSLALLAATLTLVAPLLAAQSVSPMFRGNPRHTGVTANAGAHLGGLLWRAQTGGPVRSTPALVDGTLYVGSTDGHLYAIDAATGTVRWSTDVRSPVNSSPAVAGGRVFFTSNDGVVHGLDARTGRAAWSLHTGPDAPLAWGHESGDLYLSSPTVVGDTLVVGSGDGGVYSIDAASGKLRWSYRTGGRVRSSPAIDGGVAFVGSMDGCVYALTLATGKLAWQFDTEGHSLNSGDFGYDRRTIQSSPAILGDLVVVGARDGFLYAIERATGRQRWRVDHQISWINTSPAVQQGAVYTGTSDRHFVQRVDPVTGKESWRQTVKAFSFSSPTVAGNTVFSVDASGSLYARDTETGELRWQYSVAAAIWTSPVVTPRALYFGADDGGVYALRLTDGPALRRAVFWDSSLVRATSVGIHQRLTTFLTAQGYEVLDAAKLTRFIEDRTRDREPSVVVFSLDYLPPSIAPVAADTVLLRRYLNAGGKVVWLGIPPLIFRVNPATGETSGLKELDWSAPNKLLGVDASHGIFHPRYRASPTDAGRRLGLRDWWLTTWSVEPSSVTTVLATDETGRAASWTKSFGGARGSGWVQLYTGIFSDGGAPPLDMRVVQTAAEIFP